MNLKINVKKENPINTQKLDKKEKDIIFPKLDMSEDIKKEDIESISRDKEEILIKTKQPKNSKKKKKKKESNKAKKKERKKNSENATDLEKMVETEYKKLKFKKAIVLALFLFTVLFLLFFNVYNTFVKQEKSIQQLTAEINAMNRDTAFPTEGVYGFLDMNLESLLGKKVGFLKGTTQYSIDSSNIFITRINKRTGSIANVYFQAIIDTNKDSIAHNFLLPIYYDWNTSSYHPAGDVSLRMANIDNSTKIADNDQLTFKNHQKQSAENIESAKIFMTNFLVLVYNTKGDYSQQYSGNAVLGDKNVTFERINDIVLYSSYNKNGHNGIIEYVVTTTEGLSYTITSYINIDRANKSWIINAIL